MIQLMMKDFVSILLVAKVKALLHYTMTSFLPYDHKRFFSIYIGFRSRLEDAEISLKLIFEQCNFQISLWLLCEDWKIIFVLDRLTIIRKLSWKRLFFWPYFHQPRLLTNCFHLDKKITNTQFHFLFKQTQQFPPGADHCSFYRNVTPSGGNSTFVGKYLKQRWRRITPHLMLVSFSASRTLCV